VDPIIREIILIIAQLKGRNTKTITARQIRKILGISGDQTKEVRRIANGLSFLKYPVGVLCKKNEKNPIRYEISDNFEEETKNILPLCEKKNWREWKKSKRSVRTSRY